MHLNVVGLTITSGRRREVDSVSAIPPIGHAQLREFATGDTKEPQSYMTARMMLLPRRIEDWVSIYRHSFRRVTQVTNRRKGISSRGIFPKIIWEAQSSEKSAVWTGLVG